MSISIMLKGIINKRKKLNEVKTTAESSLNAIVDKSRYPIGEIQLYLMGEDIKPFSFWMRYAGGPVTLLKAEEVLGEDSVIKEKIDDQCYIIHPANHEVRCIWEIEKNLSDRLQERQLNDQLIADFYSYQQFTKEHGYFTLPVQCKQLCEKDYSPFILSIPNVCKQNNALQNISECLVEMQCATLKKEVWEKFIDKYGEGMTQCIIRVKNNQPLQEEAVPLIVQELSQMFDIYNKYVSEDFEVRKHDKKYQRRFECDDD